MKDAAKILAAAQEEMDKFEGAVVVWKLPLIRAVNLCSLVQVALRHPDLPPETRANGQAFCDNLIDLAERGSPAVAALMRLGENLDTKKT